MSDSEYAEPLGSPVEDVIVLSRQVDQMEADLRREQIACWRHIGNVMRGRRVRAKMTLRKLAAVLGVSAPYVCDMERGNRRYTTQWLEKALETFKANNRDDFPAAKGNQ